MYPRLRIGKRGRNPDQLQIQYEIKVSSMVPKGFDSKLDPIWINHYELEALRLCDLEGLYQEDAAQQMQTSRGTIWRLLTSARPKLIRAIVEGRTLKIGYGEITNE